MQYHAPQTIGDAATLLASNDKAKVLAGGTDLLIQMRDYSRAPELVVDIKHIPDTRSIRFNGEELVVGAAVSGAELNENQTVVDLWPGVAEAFDLIGSTQIQGRATLGGNLCNASPAADTVPALIAAGATALIAGPKGERELPVEAVNAGPGRTNLERGEFIVSFRFPIRQSGAGDAYLRFIPRTEMDIAVVGVGVNLTVDTDGTCTFARVGLGAVAPTALLVEDAANALIGSKLDPTSLEKMAAAVRQACKPIDDKRGTVAYRTKVAGVLAKRAALIALERAKKNC